MEKRAQLYEGKAKKVYATDNADVVIVDYKDDATAFNGLKKGTIAGKGVINNKMSNMMFKIMESKGIPTHLVEELSDRETAVKKVEIVPLEVIIRNTAAGSFSKRLGVPEGKKLPVTVLEFSYKNDDLGDPLINDYHALAMELATPEDLPVAHDLLETLIAHQDGCVGMAANMIGVNKAIIVFDNDGTPCEMFNPVIVYRKGLYLAEEGCLSLQGQRRARRHRTIKVQWQDRQMQTHVRNFTGWTAQIIQHEIDHCSGILI